MYNKRKYDCNYSFYMNLGILGTNLLCDVTSFGDE